MPDTAASNSISPSKAVGSRRTRAEIEAIFAHSAPAASAAPLRPLNILLVAGPKDHGPGEHDYPAWQERWGRLLASSPEVEVDKAFPWPEPAQWEAADLVMFYFWNHDWSPQRYAQLDRYLARGGGLVAIHSAVIEDHDPEKLALRLGLAGRRPQLQFRHGPLELEMAAHGDHPITAGMATTGFLDESYWCLAGDAANIRILATSREAGEHRPLVWTFESSAGRVFCSILGHYSWTFDDPVFRALLLRGAAWAARTPVDRFRPLVTEGVSFERAP